MSSVQIRVDISGRDGTPHTFFRVEHPDGSTTEYGFVPKDGNIPNDQGKIDITGTDGKDSHEFQYSSPTIELTPDQYNDLMSYINRSISNPPNYNLSGDADRDIAPFQTPNCAGWVMGALSFANVPLPQGFDYDDWSPYGQFLSGNIHDLFSAAMSWVQQRFGDPLAFDLDGDGIETSGVSATNSILFDQNGDGNKIATGWISPDDGFLALDRNGNGLIDNGSELFGDSTPLPGGGLAEDGFAALAIEDTNHDGKVDAGDSGFANLRIWRDLNSDGISQSGELFTLASLGIASINIAKTENTTTLANGNTIADLGSYTKTDGSDQFWKRINNQECWREITQ